MRFNKQYIILILLTLIVAVSSCKDREDYGNALYIDSNSKKETVLFGIDPEVQKTIKTVIAKPIDQDMVVTYKIDAAAAVETFREAYYTPKAILLEENHYSLSDFKVTITAGTVRAPDITITFKNLNELDRSEVYVLPITMHSSTGVGIMKSARTMYYILEAASLINVVGDINETHVGFREVPWKNPSVVNGLKNFTLEALINARAFDNELNTLMGIEGHFLIRMGDANFPSAQIQVAKTTGNFPSGNPDFALPTNEWVHIAITHESGTSIKIYVNGEVQSEGSTGALTVNFGVGATGGFHVGYAYADDRFLNSLISECRIWNVVRSKDEIANNFYYVDPNEQGLVAYWKFNDGQDRLIKDHTVNGNDMMSGTNPPVKWVPVSLPAL